jgi:dehydrogenase/reductase SDR family member 12
LEQVRKVVAELQAKEEKVDVLVCNAGVLLNERTETKEGLEATFASHLLGGSYLLSQLLIPQLKKGTDVGRVIFVSSGGMYNVKWPADWATATGSTTSTAEYNGQFAYAYAKRGQVLVAEQLATLEPDIQWVSAHPGWVETAAVDEAYGDNKKYLAPMRNTWEGGEGICWLMHHEPAKDIESGAFYLDRTPQRKHLAGPFMTEGSYTKNSKQEVDEMMKQLQKVAFEAKK